MTKYSHLTDPLRNRRVTASMVGAILGNNPWMTRDDAMRSMVRDALGAEREFQGNIATEWGNANEQNAIMEFQMETGLKVEKAKFVTREDWAGCSPDGWVTGVIGKIGLETKCPFGLRKDEEPIFKFLDDQPHYLDQVQFSLWVTDADSWYFAQWSPHGFAYAQEYQDITWQDHSLPILRQFYAEFLDIIADPKLADDYLAPKRVIIDTPEAAKMIREYDELTEAIERATERRKDLLSDMVKMAGEKNAEFGGRKLTLTKRKGSVSWAKVAAKYCPNADVEPFTGKDSEFWGIR